MSGPFLELQCLDCGEGYPADMGDCPRRGSANCSYDSDDAKRYAADWAKIERLKKEGGYRHDSF